MTQTEKLGAKLKRDGRKLNFLKVQLAIGGGLLSDEERIRLGTRITTGIMIGTISAREATLLTRQLFPKKGR
jgi:hypothetical protein